MSKFREAFDAGRNAAMERPAAAGAPFDPAGQQHDQGRLRAAWAWVNGQMVTDSQDVGERF